jgi:hypothetical protein
MARARPVTRLVLTWFMAVAEMARLVSPRKRRLSASSSDATRCMERCRRWQLPSSSSSSVTRGGAAPGCSWWMVIDRL